MNNEKALLSLPPLVLMGLLVACSSDGALPSSGVGDSPSGGATATAHSSSGGTGSSDTDGSTGGTESASSGGSMSGDPESTGGAPSDPPRQLTFLDEAVELNRTTVTATSYSAEGVDAARRFAGAMGGTLTTFGDHQYLCFYEADGRVRVGRRSLANLASSWELASVTGYTVTTNDRHNKMTIGVAADDGSIHIAFDHHTADDLHYARTEAGVATHPEDHAWSDSVFTYTENLAQPEIFDGTFAEGTVTYPAFMEVRGTVVLYWRSGGAAQGRMNLATYDPESHDWLARRAITSELGTYEEGNVTSNKRGPYHAGFHFDALGSIYVSWIWRETGCDDSVRYCNHGLYFAQSNDLGSTWVDNAGAPFGNGTEPISVENTEPVWDIPLSIDPSNPSLASYYDPESGTLEVYIDHKDVAGQSARSTYLYTRTSDGMWSRESTMRTPGGLPVSVDNPALDAVPNEQWDFDRVATHGIATVVYQDEPEEYGAPTPLYVIDYRFAE